MSPSTLSIGAVAGGIAHGALSEVTDLATGKVPMFSSGTTSGSATTAPRHIGAHDETETSPWPTHFGPHAGAE